MNNAKLLSVMFAAFTYTFDKKEEPLFTGNITKNFSDVDKSIVLFLMDLMKDRTREEVELLMSKHLAKVMTLLNKQD